MYAVDKRDLVDHSLQRRAVLRGLTGASVTLGDVCDASPYLQRAAAAYGTRTERTCPVCRRVPLWESMWVFGDDLGQVSGSSRRAEQVAALARSHPDFAVHEVEVCLDCGWNHLLRSWRTGTPGTAPARRSRRTADDL